MKIFCAKKLGAMLLAVILCLGMIAQAGCGKKDDGDPTAASTPTASPEATPNATLDETPGATPTVTPDETPSETPDETPSATPDETSGAIPNESADESASATTPAETPADKDAVYSITYNLDGGLNANGNPDSYRATDGDITLSAPVKAGYAFAGWIGTGLTAPTEKVTISSGSLGNRSYTATWKDFENIHNAVVRNPYTDEQLAAMKDSQKDIAANPNALPLSTTDLRGFKGEGMYLARTAYTDITVDGIMDAAYTYGLHFEMDMVQTPELYKNRDTGYDVYMVCGQDGKMHVFVDVHDKDVVVNDEQWAYKWWHCDVWQMYIDFGNDRIDNVLWSFAGEGTKKYVSNIAFPENWKVLMNGTDGFTIEFEFDNNGKPFKHGDEFSFGFFYNDTMNFKSTSSYDRSNTGTKSVLNPNFHLSDISVQDAVRITAHPLNYKEEGTDDDTNEKTGEIFVDLASGASTVGIITSKYTLAYNEINYEELCKALEGLGFGVKMIREDRLTGADKFDYTIYLNTAADSDTKKAFESLTYDKCGVLVTEEKMIGFGWTWDQNDLLCDVILSLLGSAAGGNEVPIGESYVYSRENVRGDDVPLVDGTYCVIDSGEDAYIVVKQNTSLDYFNSYGELLKKAGYTLYTTNTMASVHTATYYTEDTVINLVYSDEASEKTLRVIVETTEKTNLPALEVEESGLGVISSVTQVDLGAGLCHIIKLDNGEFIIVDSGNQGKQSKIYEAIVSLHKSNRPIVVAAWIFTHFHQDHIGGFCDFMDNDEYIEKVRIKSIIYNPPERFFLDISKQNSSGDRANIIRWKGHLEKLQEKGAKIYQARTGQKYLIGNAMLEILGTYDDLAPFYVRADISNHTSLIFTVTVEGQKLMYVGDAMSSGLLLAAKRYGDYLQSDILQLSHHGYGDGSTDNAFYKAVDAPCVLHPGTSLSGGAEKWAVGNATTVYKYGTGNITLPLTNNVNIQ